MAKTLLDVVQDEHGRVLGYSELHSSEHDPTHSVVRHVENDDHILERNKRLRLDGYLKPGNKLALHDDDIRFSLSIPPLQWALLQRDEPELVRQLTKGDEQERIAAAQRLSIMHPEWCNTAANW